MTDQEIIDKAVEKALLLIPEVIGNQMKRQAVLHKINSEFYKDHPEFKDHKDVVSAIVEEEESKTPLEKYEDILRGSVSKIKSKIKALESLDTASVQRKPLRDYTNFEPTDDNFNPNGAL